MHSTMERSGGTGFGGGMGGFWEGVSQSFLIYRDLPRGRDQVCVATPAEPRGEKKLFCCANFGR